MSAAFRTFLMMLCAFAAVWVYRFRSTEISTWLHPASPLEAEAKHPLASPVEKVLEPELSTAWIRVRGQPPLRDVAAPPPEDPLDGDVEEGVRLSQEEELLAADLPLPEDPEATEAEETTLLEEGAVVEETPPLTDGETGGAQAPVLRREPEPPKDAELPDGIVGYEEITYTVKDGESLWKIAQKVLGSGIRYREIYELNKAVLKGDEARLPPGTELKIRKSAREERLKNPSRAVDTSVEGKSAQSGSARGRSPKGKSSDSPKKSVRRK